jgi:hypothetical protein
MGNQQSSTSPSDDSSYQKRFSRSRKTLTLKNSKNVRAVKSVDCLASVRDEDSVILQPGAFTRRSRSKHDLRLVNTIEFVPPVPDLNPYSNPNHDIYRESELLEFQQQFDQTAQLQYRQPNPEYLYEQPPKSTPVYRPTGTDEFVNFRPQNLAGRRPSERRSLYAGANNGSSGSNLSKSSSLIRTNPAASRSRLSLIREPIQLNSQEDAIDVRPLKRNSSANLVSRIKQSSLLRGRSSRRHSGNRFTLDISDDELPQQPQSESDIYPEGDPVLYGLTPPGGYSDGRPFTPELNVPVLGSFGQGTLRITNGTASPAPSESRTRLLRPPAENNRNTHLDRSSRQSSPMRQKPSPLSTSDENNSSRRRSQSLQNPRNRPTSYPNSELMQNSAQDLSTNSEFNEAVPVLNFEATDGDVTPRQSMQQLPQRPKLIKFPHGSREYALAVLDGEIDGTAKSPESTTFSFEQGADETPKRQQTRPADNGFSQSASSQSLRKADSFRTIASSVSVGTDWQGSENASIGSSFTSYDTLPVGSPDNNCRKSSFSTRTQDSTRPLSSRLTSDNSFRVIPQSTITRPTLEPKRSSGKLRKARPVSTIDLSRPTSVQQYRDEAQLHIAPPPPSVPVSVAIRHAARMQNFSRANPPQTRHNSLSAIEQPLPKDLNRSQSAIFQSAQPLRQPVVQRQSSLEQIVNRPKIERKPLPQNSAIRSSVVPPSHIAMNTSAKRRTLQPPKDFDLSEPFDDNPGAGPYDAAMRAFKQSPEAAPKGRTTTMSSDRPRDRHIQNVIDPRSRSRPRSLHSDTYGRRSQSPGARYRPLQDAPPVPVHRLAKSQENLLNISYRVTPNNDYSRRPQSAHPSVVMGKGRHPMQQQPMYHTVRQRSSNEKMQSMVSVEPFLSSESSTPDVREYAIFYERQREIERDTRQRERRRKSTGEALGLGRYQGEFGFGYEQALGADGSIRVHEIQRKASRTSQNWAHDLSTSAVHIHG